MMKYEKPLSGKARFWLGILACAFVGWVASSASYFYSNQEIQNEYNPYWYRNFVYDVFDKDECSLKMNEKTTVNTDVLIYNGNPFSRYYFYMPALVRVRYAVNTGSGYVRKTNENKKTFYVTSDICNGGCSYFTAAAKDTESFLYNEKDGAYYYKGIVNANQRIQHLDYLIFEAGKSLGFKNNTSLTTFTTALDGSEKFDSTGRSVSLGTGDSVEVGSCDLKIFVDVLGATDGKGNTLELTGNETVDDMESYWNDLGLRLPAYGEYIN